MAPQPKMIKLSVSPPAVAQARSAAQTAYGIEEIRREILRHVPPAGLARFMRVEKRCMRDVSKELYRTVRYDDVERMMSCDPIRREIYSSFVVEVDARSMTVSLAMRQDIRWRDVLSQFHLEDHFTATWEECDARVIDIVVPPLRQAFPSLRRVTFGPRPGRYGKIDWDNRNPACTVHLEPDDRSSPSDGVAGGGIIEVRLNRQLHLNQKPPREIRPPRKPIALEGYTARYRFNLMICRPVTSRTPQDTPVPAERLDEWITILVTGSWLSNLHNSIIIANLPVTIIHLITLLESQATLGYTGRLQKLAVKSLSSFSIQEFQSFATIASPALTSLTLTGTRQVQPDSSQSSPMTHRDVPVLLSTIRQSLPYLVDLKIEINGLDEAEAAELLWHGCLWLKGSVKRLRVATGRRKSGIRWSWTSFNVIRVLASICASDAEIEVSQYFNASDYPNTWKDQTAYLQYLHRQPRQCQLHLATVNFPAIGINHLRDVLQLGYDQDGRPLKAIAIRPWTREKSQTASWATLTLCNTWERFQRIDSVITEHDAAAERLDEIAATAPAWEKAAMAQQLLDQLETHEKLALAFRDGLQVEAVRAYVESLRGIE